MSKHSPGPWTWGDDQCLCSGDEVVIQVNEYMDASIEDARLLAAAPEMLTALKDVVASMEAWERECTDEIAVTIVCSDVRALIKRIEGE